MRPVRSVLVALALTFAVTAVVTASEKVHIFQKGDQIIVKIHETGDRLTPYQYVESDERRHSDDPLTLYYRIDQTELPPGITWEETETAIENAVATFNGVNCGRNLQLVRVDEYVTDDMGYLQYGLGLGGSPTHRADITFAGWVGQDFWTAVDPNANAIALPLVFDSDDTTPYFGWDVFLPGMDFSDLNEDHKYDLYATEIYFNVNSNYVIDQDEQANTLFYIDLESIVLHELGHALGIGHFGNTTIVLDENWNFVDLQINEHSPNLMNTNNYLVSQEVYGSDQAAFCSIYGDWGKSRKP